jgi:hypothetical protein
VVTRLAALFDRAFAALRIGAQDGGNEINRLIVVVVLEQLFGFVLHVDVEDGEEKARIRQAG